MAGGEKRLPTPLFFPSEHFFRFRLLTGAFEMGNPFKSLHLDYSIRSLARMLGSVLWQASGAVHVRPATKACTSDGISL
jgi:hypothetical protein